MERALTHLFRGWVSRKQQLLPIRFDPSFALRVSIELLTVVRLDYNSFPDHSEATRYSMLVGTAQGVKLPPILVLQLCDGLEKRKKRLRISSEWNGQCTKAYLVDSNHGYMRSYSDCHSARIAESSEIC